MDNGVVSDWYSNLNKAPWTPPGWVFGVSWTLIMITFSIFMAKFWSYGNTTIVTLFIAAWILNVVWNPLFFKYHLTTISLFEIVSLTLLIGYFIILGVKQIGLGYTLLLVPYFIWMLIATSLNAYIVFKN